MSLPFVPHAMARRLALSQAQPTRRIRVSKQGELKDVHGSAQESAEDSFTVRHRQIRSHLRTTNVLSTRSQEVTLGKREC